MLFLVSRVILLGLAASLAVALGLAIRWAIPNDAATVWIWGAGLFIFGLVDVRYWNVLEVAKDIVDQDGLSAREIESLQEKINLRRRFVLYRWSSSLVTLVILSVCLTLTQFGTGLPTILQLSIFTLGYCCLGCALVLALWMGRDYQELVVFRDEQRLEHATQEEWETEIDRMVASPKPDLTKDEHLKGYGRTRPIKSRAKH